MSYMQICINPGSIIKLLFKSKAKISSKRVPFFETSQKGSRGLLTRGIAIRASFHCVRAEASDCAAVLVLVHDSEYKKALALDSYALPVPPFLEFSTEKIKIVTILIVVPPPINGIPPHHIPYQIISPPSYIHKMSSTLYAPGGRKRSADA